ncbi:MAG: haloacid dehalogenase-like hydrolase [Alphaproteobacteria bacterium]|nr:haloacid dehalogenase-like hydrolase [Alphaproteobacteria bacterium]
MLTSQRPIYTLIPLVLDLDGTLIHTDTFHEMMVSLLTRKPLILLRLPFWFLKGRAYAKAQLVEHAEVNLATLPYNKQLLAFAQKEGRPLILATGTDQRLAQKISDHLGIFQDVIGSNGKINMTGHQKGKALCERFGRQGFDYAGDSSVDTSVWQVSRKALVVCPKWRVLQKARALKNAEHIHYIPRDYSRLFSFLLALRPFFWLFNLLASSASLGIGLSFLSSGLLILNDLLLMEKERTGLCKRKSVFARGKLHLQTAFMMSPLLILSSLFFMWSILGNGLYIVVYISLLLGLDRMTRVVSPPLRWAVLGLFQTLAAII